MRGPAVDVENGSIPAELLYELSSHPDVVRETRDLANAIAADARQLAAVKTGWLKSRGIGVEKVEDDRTGLVHFIVGWTRFGWYGWLVEAGTEDTPPQPHLVPAAIKHGARLAGGTD